ncbi:MAG: endonuclease/exonuclease/phosphatase family protein [Pseudobdellovibrionaceae bacterium]
MKKSGLKASILSSKIFQTTMIATAVAVLLASCQQSPMAGLAESSTRINDAAAKASVAGKLGNAKPPWIFTAKAADEISMMTYNVENLFDTEQDADREDYTNLPLSLKQNKAHRDFCKKMRVPKYREECLTKDWNDDFLEAKMRNLAEVVLDLDGGMGPDVLLLQEVENISVLSQWNKKYLSKANYQTLVLLEGFDERGIDTALLSRFPLKGKPTLHKIPFDLKKIGETDETKAKSRGILETTLLSPKKKEMTFFIVHLPSQGNPTGMRKQATDFLLSLMKKKNHFVAAGGDFNITKEEEEEQGYFKNMIQNQFEVSHFYGCPGCEGTYNYKKRWSFLDAVVFSKDFAKMGFQIQPNQIDVVRYNPNYLYRDSYPKFFKTEDLTGASDHFPLYMRLSEK